MAVRSRIEVVRLLLQDCTAPQLRGLLSSHCCVVVVHLEVIHAVV
jgi:hypothetical protein